MDNNERTWMLRALAIAESGRGHVEPNPLVGAVVVRDDKVVGEGWHKRYGDAHGEVNALAAAGEAARGATLFVSLEPCCHQGKTPPCTEAIVASGIKRVVAAMLDPFPQVAGQGRASLHAAGLTVEIGLCEAEARRLNAPYLTLLTQGRPYVHAKWAMTLDGKICSKSGDSKWIGSPSARRAVHTLRGRMDAIIIGIGTALADDPLLTARPPGARVATRVVLDSQGRLPPDGRLASSAQEWPLLIATVGEIPAGDPLRSTGCEILSFHEELGRPPIAELLKELGRRRMTNVLVEGGRELLGGFFDAGLVDEVWAFVAPTIIGGGGKAPVGGSGVDKIADGLTLLDQQVELFENDVLIHGRTR